MGHQPDERNEKQKFANLSCFQEYSVPLLVRQSFDIFLLRFRVSTLGKLPTLFQLFFSDLKDFLFFRKSNSAHFVTTQDLVNTVQSEETAFERCPAYRSALLPKTGQICSMICWRACFPSNRIAPQEVNRTESIGSSGLAGDSAHFSSECSLRLILFDFKAKIY